MPDSEEKFFKFIPSRAEIRCHHCNFNFKMVTVMEVSSSLEEQALKRKEKLKGLKRKKQGDDSENSVCESDQENATLPR